MKPLIVVNHDYSERQVPLIQASTSNVEKRERGEGERGRERERERERERDVNTVNAGIGPDRLTPRTNYPFLPVSLAAVTPCCPFSFPSSYAFSSVFYIPLQLAGK